MSATRVTFAEVLRDEYEYFHDPDPLREWTLQDRDVHELPVLVEKVRTTKETDRAAETFAPALVELARRTVEPTKEGVLDALTGMVCDASLFAKLRADGGVRALLLDRAHPLLRRLAAVPCARRVLFSDPDVARRIAEDPALIELFTTRTPALLRLMATDGFPELVRLYPSLLATIADSDALQRYADADGDAVKARVHRKELVSLFRNASTKMRAVRRTFLGARQQAVTEVDGRMNILAADAQALLESLPSAGADLVDAPDAARERAALSQFNVLLLECAYGGHIADGHDLRDLYSRIHKKNVAALCLSGGGIRSATFNLGILQGLAEQKLLTQFHYLSTVSGGGYIGSWLSSWMRRHSDGPWGVARDLCAKPEDPLAPEVRPIQHLRAYSSYLAPRGSTLSVDTWTIVATYLRNLFLNWTMLIPALLAFLVLPRAVELLVVAGMTDGDRFDILKWIVVGGGAVAAIAIGSVRPALDRPPGAALRSEEDQRDRAARFRWWLIPLLVSGAAFTALWASVEDIEHQLIFGFNPLGWHIYALMFAVVNLAGAFLYSIRHVAASIGIISAPSRPLRDWVRDWRKTAVARPTGWSYLGVVPSVIAAVRAFRVRAWWRAIQSLFFDDWRRLLREVLAAVFAGAIGGTLLYAIFRGLFPPESLDDVAGWPRLEVYVCVALPLFLAVFFVQASLLAGLTTSRSTDHDREWWARSSSWIFICGIVYLAVSSAVILAPIAILEWQKIAASLGGVSAIAAWLLARGGKMAATPKEKEVVGAAHWRTLSLRIAALVCLVFLVALLSLTTTALLSWVGSNAEDAATLVAEQSKVFGDAPIASVGTVIAKAIAYSTVLEGWIELLEEQRITIFGDTPANGVSWHLSVLRGSSEAIISAFVAIMLLIALGMSRVLNVNIYSMHGMYRNRLIRAYLGASRMLRRADPFTGFDPRDNLAMWQLRPEALWTSSFPSFDAFVRRFVDDARSAAPDAPRPVLAQLPEHVRVRVTTYDAMVRARLAGAAVTSSLSGTDVEVELIDALNRLMLERDLKYDLAVPGSINSFRANRVFLDERFAGVLAPYASDRVSDRTRTEPVRQPERHNGRVVGSTPRQRRRPPLHVLNMALNLVAGQNLAWRERKADSFTVTPLHAGNKRLGYRDSVSYGDAISLGTAVAVSGAAVSPNHGYNSSPVVTFLMTLFNARLGWWLGNPGAAGEQTYATAGPRRSIKSILDEAFGRTTDTSDYVFLSDGGHFDNLGVYEMVLRRCRYIVVCDASEDQRYAFGDLANAVRKIRVDLGIDVRLKSMFIGPESADQAQSFGRYCALGVIDYDRVDVIEKGYPQMGYLIYIKPVVYADCPPDVKNYRKENNDFPHESTVDQFFSESQFESYRALGQHSVKQICESLQQQGKRRKKVSDEEVRTIFQLFRGTAEYLEVAMKEQAEKDDAMTFFARRKARRARVGSDPSALGSDPGLR